MSGKPAARLSDPTACPIPGHGTNPIVTGSGDVLFDGLSAARLSDTSACGSAIAADSTPFGHSAHADPDTCSTLIRTGSRSAATQGWHC
ncbi:PAAR domain-containing protein [Pseudomonas mendocina]|nr:PAAR domain-containing protein [Pseudomonas mendocina]